MHLFCHGSQHVTDPTESAFWLTDGPLRISDLIEQHDPGPRELAFLSACQTATGSPRALDEAIHLAAAIQLLGYRHVIATLWSIYDSTAPDIADTVYTKLTATGTPDTNHAAHALHHAVTALRAKHPTEPLAWAPYLQHRPLRGRVLNQSGRTGCCSASWRPPPTRPVFTGFGAPGITR